MSPTVTEIRAGLKTVARLIYLYGDDYWPIFDRLEKELSILENRQVRLDEYLEADDVPSYSKKEQYNV